MDHDSESGLSSSAWTGVVVALPQEAQCLGLAAAKAGSLIELGSHARVLVAGMGEMRAERAAKILLEEGASALLSFGMAGALDPGLRPGDLLLPKTVLRRNAVHEVNPGWHARVVDRLNGPEGIAMGAMLHADEPLASVRQKHAARRLTGAVAVDMESGAVARIAEITGVPFLVLRAVADTAWRALPGAALAAMDADGRLRPYDLLKALLRHPSEIWDLRKLAVDYQAARRSLSGLRSDFDELVFPPPRSLS
jgi:adenosylhomocysteine nucleosidase